jgi:hypothetical protein
MRARASSRLAHAALRRAAGLLLHLGWPSVRRRLLSLPIPPAPLLRPSLRGPRLRLSAAAASRLDPLSSARQAQAPAASFACAFATLCLAAFSPLPAHCAPPSGPRCPA